MDKKDSGGWDLENSYDKLPKIFYTKMKPAPVKAPQLVKFNGGLAAELGLAVDGEAEIFAGNQLPPGADPLAQAYAGHQFGSFTKLGDGRAVLLGEQVGKDGDRRDIQLKGSGPTPYSRGGDGRAALGPMLREYVISEAMHALRIPTTRSLAVVKTGEPVYRESVLEGAILTRVASSHLRVGTFEYASAWGSEEDVKALADYAIERHDPELKGEPERYRLFLEKVIGRQAALVAKWQLAGFIHGVMNTDNMTISGETIDYGPCAFMDVYNPATVFSSIDIQGRYAYGNQPQIAMWNLARFAETLLPLLGEEEKAAVKIAEEALKLFSGFFNQHWLDGMRAKLGIFNGEEEDGKLVGDLLDEMEKQQADYTNTFLALTPGRETDAPLEGTPELGEWQARWQARLGRQPESQAEVEKKMKASNPAVIPRNHLVEEALEAAVGREDYSVFETLLSVLGTPYDHTAGQAAYANVPRADKPYRTYCGT